MALTEAQRKAANELFKRGLNVDGSPLNDQQKQSISALQARGVDPAETLLADQQRPAGALTRFGVGTITPTLQTLQSLQQQTAPLRQIAPQVVGKPLIDIAALRQRLPQPTGIAGGLGQIAGFAPLVAAPESVAAGTETALGKAIARGLGGTAVGAGTFPKSPGFGALIGGATGGLLGGAPLALRALFGNNTSKELTQTALDEMSGKLHTARKATSLEDNAQSAAIQIKDLHSALIKDYESQIGEVMDQHENTQIDTPEFGKFQGAITKLGKRSTKESMAEFEKNPTLLTAHNLQSTLGSNIRAITPRSVQDVNDVEALNDARNSLKSDIHNSLDVADPTGESSNKYIGASDFFRDNIVPFDSKRGLKDIATGKVTSPRNLTTIFSKPEDSILSIVDKLPPSFKNKILYDTLGRNQKTINPKRFVTAIDRLDTQGLAKHYLPDDLADARDVIETNLAHEKGIIPKIVKGGLIRIPEWLIAGTALRMGIPAITGREQSSLGGQ